MEIYFQCTECKQVEPINITALSANGFMLRCSVCKTEFTFGVVAVEHLRAPDVAERAATLSGLYNCQLCGEEKCRQPGFCTECLTPPTEDEVKSWGVA